MYAAEPGEDYNGELSVVASRRLLREQAALNREGLEAQGIFHHFHEEQKHKAVAVILGPDDTPYARGPYIFEFTFPNTYPLKPPWAKFVTGDGRVRFNPNLYVNGKNEPGHEHESGSDCDLYAAMLRYENVAVAALQLNTLSPSWPLRALLGGIFLCNFPAYCNALSEFTACEGSMDRCPVYGFVTKYAPSRVRQQLHELQAALLEEPEVVSLAEQLRSQAVLLCVEEASSSETLRPLTPPRHLSMDSGRVHVAHGLFRVGPGARRFLRRCCLLSLATAGLAAAAGAGVTFATSSLFHS